MNQRSSGSSLQAFLTYIGAVFLSKTITEIILCCWWWTMLRERNG